MNDITIPTERGALAALGEVQAVQQVQTQYATAIAVQKPRELAMIEKRCLQEADLAGESFFYGWGAGKDRIEGPSIDCAMALIRAFGNCAIELRPVVETIDAWFFTAAFVDLETGFTLERQFRQSKRWMVYGKHDEARKEDIRFQIGQSKAIRNVVLNALPKWLSTKMIERAKAGVRATIEKLIGASGLEKVVVAVSNRLGGFGISEQQILSKFSRSTMLALTLEDLVIIKGDVSALEAGHDVAMNLYPLPETNGSGAPATGTKAEQMAKALAERKAVAESKPADTVAGAAQANVGGQGAKEVVDPAARREGSIAWWLGQIPTFKDKATLMRRHETWDSVREGHATVDQESVEAAFAARLQELTA